MSSAATTNYQQQQQAQDGKRIIAANVKLYRAARGRTQRCTHRLSERDEPLSQLQPWQHPRNRTAEARRDPRCRVLDVEELGRNVKKGEKGIRILAPIIGVRRKKDEEAEKDITKQNTRGFGRVS